MEKIRMPNIKEDAPKLEDEEEQDEENFDDLFPEDNTLDGNFADEIQDEDNEEKPEDNEILEDNEEIGDNEEIDPDGDFEADEDLEADEEIFRENPLRAFWIRNGEIQNLLGEILTVLNEIKDRWELKK